MIPDLKPHAIVGAATQLWRRLPIVPVVLLSAWLGSCDKVPLLAPSGTTIRLFTNAQVLPLNGSAQISASVQETGGWPVQNGTVVTFTTSLGSVTPSEATTTDGKVTVIFNAGSLSGTAVINAFSGSSATTSSTTTGTGTTASTTTGTGVSILVGAAAATTVVATASPSSVSQLGGTATITASVLDASNNGLAGVPVVFTTDQGSLSPVSATTNASGNATTTLTTNQTATVTITAGTKTATAKVTAVAVPTVTVTGPTTTPTAGLTATFSVTATAGSGSAPIRTVTVDFGDGSSASLGAASGTLSVPHVYKNAGTYNVTAVAIDASGASTSATTPVVVFAAVPFTLTVTSSSGRIDQTITANAIPSAGAPVINKFIWNWGDGTINETAGPSNSHVYLTGSFPSTLTSFTFSITVTAIGEDGRQGFGSTTTIISR